MPGGTERAGARLEHASPGRTRYRVPDRRGNASFFTGVAMSLRKQAGVREVLCNPGTASVLVLHDQDVSAEQLFALGEREGWFTHLPPVDLGTPIEELRKFYERLEAFALLTTKGRLDIESMAFVLLVLSALAGIARGDVALRSGTAIWYALELIRRPSPAERRRMEEHRVHAEEAIDSNVT